ncbi:MAG: glycosyltransferase family 4 protein [Deferrisomatales bacterium]
MDGRPGAPAMKVALVYKEFGTYGGTERYMTGLARELVGAGHEVHVFARRWEALPGVRFHRVRRLGPGKIAKLLSFAFFARNVNASGEFDVVQWFNKTTRHDVLFTGGGTHRAWMTESLLAIRSPWRRRLKALGRRLSPLQWLSLWMEGRVLRGRRYRKIIAVSRKIRDQIVAMYGVPADDIRVIHNGVDLAQFNTEGRDEARRRVRAAHGLAAGDVVVTFVATNFYLKGLEYLIRALARIPRPDLRLLVVGGDDPAPHRRAAERLGVGERVVFAGRQAAVKPYYCAGDLFVYPTLYDPFANVSLEAMACGLPIVTSRVNGASDVLTDGVDGFVLEDPTDEVEIARRIERLLDPGTRAAMAARAHALALTYGMPRHFGQVMEVYREVVARPGAPG